MGKLTFQIQEEAKLRAGERFSLAGLRSKLFGNKRDVMLSFQTIPSTRKYGQNRPAPAPVPVVRPSYFDPLPNCRPFVAMPARTVCAKPALAPAAASQQPAVPNQTTYKGFVIHTVRLEDGSWASFHHPVDADPATVRDRPAPTAQRFMAQVLALASAEIEIDDLEVI